MHRPRQPAAHNLNMPYLLSLPIQIRHKGRNACLACKKAHIKCVYDEGRRSCRRCSTRSTACSRALGTHQPAVEEIPARPTPLPTETTPVHQMRLGNTTDVQLVSQDIPTGQPHATTRYGDAQHSFYQHPCDVGCDQFRGWCPSFDPPQASEVVDPPDMLYGTAPQDDLPFPCSYPTAILWGVNPQDDGQHQITYAQHSSSWSDSQNDLLFSPEAHLSSAPSLCSPPEGGTLPYLAGSDGEDHAHPTHFPSM
ncbi:hypothetical protein EDC04DRAFT_606111 [Pisolithus marmoratus]|nr:hypothetical protein EDC04DRAFT_606111 [Pisolithus marmoratus]